MILFGAGEECQLRRIPIARHEAFQIVAIPRLLLRVQHTLDLTLRAAVVAIRNLRADFTT